ncbi:hypothetical protein HRR83_003048 [Exophiala dermatitidis]|uniref:Uncharacterized protein n=2 Tax=Exophiala dermatitidis TaxID=5970 RepID=H6BNW3_EXODN|nr:uncharacterized protein HMPREF1120_00595 [Exophiala dermatitidis NIH/UT8656]KAJ4504817.1 hypothetical protein HRR75_007630 [Exophiala dermatitidis]EHY52381.1 hypothetical protein HMPREF1120_00595 [Exophiala dermatitidis NIH/UT8656]KAJ4506408.1 hypothetical protein HRR73_008207 [Exophiala dermatitidis]KAJ4506989.1 hypothetical protein HRR74_008306 [Exophiala dermatitidis]KAJ4547993.1 hypothetical protein HRR76_000612 [Exophiala dermatitidis]
MGSPPPVLLLAVRAAFQSCARQYAASRRTQFSTLRPLLKSPQQPRRADNLPIQVVHSQLKAQKKSQASPSPSLPPSPQASTEVVPVAKDEKAVDSGRKVEVPMKIIPKAEIAPNLTLSPKERLHIEQLTRSLPPRTEPKVYKQRLRIYTAGNGRIYMLTFLRFATIIALCFVTIIVAPAHWVNGSPLWLVAGVWLAGFIPFIYVNWTLRPIVTEVFLRLPTSVQHSPKLAMEYAKSLPVDAVLDLRFMRASTLTDMVSLKLTNTKPIKSAFRPVSFEWVGPLVERGSLLRPNPTQFYVRPQSAGGRAARDVTPGIWGKVYERLTGLESNAVSKWRR